MNESEIVKERRSVGEARGVNAEGEDEADSERLGSAGVALCRLHVSRRAN